MRGVLVSIAAAVTVAAVAPAVLAGGSASRPSMPSYPRDGQAIREGQSFHFDWRWGTGQYLGGPYVSRFRSMRKAVGMGGKWVTASNMGTFELSGKRGSGFKLGPYRPPFTGWWYWRVCAVSIYGEDDKCSFSGPVFRFRIVPRAVTFVFTGRRGQTDAGADAIILRVLARGKGSPVEDYKVCWRRTDGERCTDPDSGLGTFIVYSGLRRTDFAIPLSARTVVDGRFSAWLLYDGRKVATYSVTV